MKKAILALVFTMAACGQGQGGSGSTSTGVDVCYGLSGSYKNGADQVSLVQNGTFYRCTVSVNCTYQGGGQGIGVHFNLERKNGDGSYHLEQPIVNGVLNDPSTQDHGCPLGWTDCRFDAVGNNLTVDCRYNATTEHGPTTYAKQ